MTHIAVRSADIPLSAPRLKMLRALATLVFDVVRDLNRYVDAAACVHRVDDAAQGRNRTNFRTPFESGSIPRHHG